MNIKLINALLNEDESKKKIDEMILELERKMDDLLDEYGRIRDFIYSNSFIEEYLELFSSQIEDYSQNILSETDYFYFKALGIIQGYFFNDCKDLNKTMEVSNFLYRTGLSPLSFCSKEIRNDFEVIKQAIIYTNGRALQDLDSAYKDDKDFISGWIAFYPRAYPLLNETLKDDFPLLKLAIGAGPDLIKYSSKRIRSNREMMLELVKESPFSLLFMEDEFKNDPIYIKEAIEVDPAVYYSLSQDFQDNEEIKQYLQARIEKYPFAYKVLLDPPPRPLFKKK
ncbi:MAG: DUF4116 domain-containing protein [Bacilli bacterium]|nr:DUF4116 domain-containing protein [Bacilli bacterium]